MIATILAAGMAKRLRPLTDKQPKCLLKIGGTSLLQRSIDILTAHNIHEFVIVTGYLEHQVRYFLHNHYPKETFHLIFNSDYVTTNNLYSLWLTRPYNDGKEFLLLDSDLLYDTQIIDRLLQQTGTALAVNRHELGEEEMKVLVNDKLEVTAINKTCDPAQAYGESVGIEKMTAPYSRILFQELSQIVEQEKGVGLFYELAFERLIPKKYGFQAVDTTDLFSMELDTEEDFNRAQQLFTTQKNNR